VSEAHKAVVKEFCPGPHVGASAADAASNWYVRGNPFLDFIPAVLAMQQSRIDKASPSMWNSIGSSALFQKAVGRWVPLVSVKS
jgi:hypothetical protein